MKTATVKPLECCHADTGLSGYWSGHHLPHVQIPVWSGMTLAEIKAAILAEIKAAILAEMGECIQGADAAFLHDWRDEHDQARADAWHRRARAAVRRMKPARKGQRRFFLDLEPQTERGAWERQAINVLAENPEQAAERAQLAATLAGKYIGATYSAQKA